MVVVRAVDPDWIGVVDCDLEDHWLCEFGTSQLNALTVLLLEALGAGFGSLHSFPSI